MESTLLGGGADDTFCSLIIEDDHYVAYGWSSSTVHGSRKPFLVTFTKDLQVIKQIIYKGSYGGILELIAEASETDTYFLVSGVHTGGGTSWRATVLEVTSDTYEVVDHHAHGYSGVWGHLIYKIMPIPKEYNHSAQMVFLGCIYTDAGQRISTVCTYDLAKGFVERKRIDAPGSWKMLKDGIITAEKIIGLGTVYTNRYEGALVELDHNLAQERVFLFNAGFSTDFYHFCKTATGYLIVGRERGVLAGSNSILLVELDEDYNVMRQARIMGGLDTQCSSIEIDASGNILISGQHTKIGGKAQDILLMQLDKNFTIVKSVIFGGSGNEKKTRAKFTQNESVTIVGGITGKTAYSDAFIATFTGNWEKVTGTLASNEFISFELAPEFTVETDFVVNKQEFDAVKVSTLALNSYKGSVVPDDTINLIKTF